MCFVCLLIYLFVCGGVSMSFIQVLYKFLWAIPIFIYSISLGESSEVLKIFFSFYGFLLHALMLESIS